MSLILLHNGSAVDLAAAHCELGSLVRSFAGPDSLVLRRAIAFDEPSDWQNEDAISLLLDGVPVFEGRIKASERLCSREREQIAYTCLGARAQADAVPFRRVVAGAPTARVVYNCPIEEEFHEAGCVALPGRAATVGEIAADILDAMAAELAGIIGDGSPGSGYVQAELDALAAVPPMFIFPGLSVDAALRSLLAYAPDFGYWVDPASHKARFFDLHALEEKNVPGVAGAVLRQQLVLSTDRCYSACTVLGGPELVDIFEELTPAWDTALEADWTSDKADKFPDTYGLVWRLFATAEPAQEGGVVAPDRFVGTGDPLIAIASNVGGHPEAAACKATVVDDTKLLLDTRARVWDPAQGKHVTAAVRARFAYAKGRVSGRFPATGHAGTAHTRRGLVRERILLEEERGKKIIKGTVDEVLSPTEFLVYGGLAADHELAGTTVEFNGDGITHTLADNDAGTITLAQAPQDPIEAGDAFVLTVQDDTLKCFENGTLSILEKYAKETLERAMDELAEGSVPLAGLDWSLRLGQKVSFTGTNDPDYEGLGAPLVAVEHDLARERTVLTLTTERHGALLTWGDLERQLRGDTEAAEVCRQLRRMWRRHRRRRGRVGAIGDPHELDPDGPLVGDGIWIGLAYQQIGHTGPGPVHRTLGGSGRFIQWIALDLRGHVVEAGVGTFS